MKLKIIHIVVAFFLSSIAMSQDKVFKQFFYDDGKVASEGTMVNGKPDGYWISYYPNGNKKSEGNRENLQLSGLWKFYNEEGNLVSEYNYREGKKDGFKNTYYLQTGSLLSEENFIEDKREGLSNYYYPNGNLKSFLFFVNGMEEGAAYEFGEDGRIITNIKYQKSFVSKQENINRYDRKGEKRGIWKVFYEHGVIKLEESYSHGLKDGYFKTYDKYGSLIKTEKYLNGILQEDVPELIKLDVKNNYYEDGTIKSTGGYHNDLEEGVHRVFTREGMIEGAKVYKKGKVVSEGMYDERGLKQGHWKEYYSDGKLRSEGDYKDSERVGKWVFYFPNGKIEQEGSYDVNGRIKGKWKWYYDTGNILREENFINGLRDGMMIEYSDSGNVITTGEFVEGLEEGKWIYELGDHKEIGTYQMGEMHGEWKHWYNNGKLSFEGNYVDGNPDGRHRHYFRNGRVEKEGKYIMGKKEGDWKYNTEDGLLYLTITYSNGVETKYDGMKIKDPRGKSRK